MGGDAVTVRAFEARDELRVLELLQLAFGEWPRQLDGVEPSEFFHWKHMECPFGPSIALVAEWEGAVVGFLGLMPWPLRAGQRLLPTMRGVDLAVDPAFQRRGVSMALIRSTREQYSPDVALAWTNPNEHSRGGILKSGRRRVGGLTRFLGVGGSLRRTVRRAAVDGSGAPWQLPTGAPSAAEVLNDGGLVARVLGSMHAPDQTLTTPKTLAYLRWRYGRFEEYRAVVAATEGGAAGLAIFRCARHGRFWVARVCELLVEHDDARTTRQLLRKVRRSSGADVIACFLRSRRQAALYGFLRSPRGAMLTANPLHSDLMPDPTQPGSWALALGDLELL